MTSHVFTFAAKITALIEAPDRESALRKLRRCHNSADLWAPLDTASAERGEPGFGILGCAIRFIGRLS
jgi:hypothetical protein